MRSNPFPKSPLHLSFDKREVQGLLRKWIWFQPILGISWTGKTVFDWSSRNKMPKTPGIPFRFHAHPKLVRVSEMDLELEMDLVSNRNPFLAPSFLREPALNDEL